MTTPHIPSAATPAVAASLGLWHEMIAADDLSRLREIVAEDAMFRSPMAHAPYASADALVLALTTVIQVFKDFTYHRSFVSDDGLDVVLEFSATVNGKSLKGIDMIRFGADGLIRDFEVMIRPMSGIQALGAEMGARVGGSLPAFKAKA
ncbi:nuclear transport factor 2 family protein (plasmid) [Tistrella bauzanensis]|uniref:Nuclear transport factor 2 family protein n=1 Tax=Tistrella arctica TaxID=3133430 RepID=A0ABU9YP73_9PROT